MINTLRTAAFALAAVMTLTATSPVLADEGENAIKYRKSVMKAVGGHMGAIAAIVSGKVPHKGDLKAHADAMAALSTITAHSFPEGSDFGETEAKADIWDNPADFKKAVMAFQTAAAGMAKVAGSGDMKAAGGALKALGGACKGCHKTFREKHKH